MASVIFVGNKVDFDTFLDDYKVEKQIRAFEVDIYDEKVTIAVAREIKRSLSYVISGNKLLVINSEVTLEAQNALLKCLEESSENVHFIFCTQLVDDLLPTIQSRSKMVVKRTNNLKVNNLDNLQDQSFKGNINFENYEDLLSLANNDLKNVIPILREIMLSHDSTHEQKDISYTFCKQLLRLVPLVENNNVSPTAIADIIFAPYFPIDN